MPSTRERREARRAAILTDMLAVVERLIGEGTSYAEITVDRLIAEADIARSTFYVYFEGKGALLIATSRRR